MRQRSITLGLLWLAMAALLALFLLLLGLRVTGGPDLNAALNAALALNVLLLGVPAALLALWRQRDDGATARQAVTEARPRVIAELSQGLRTPLNAVMGMTQLALQTSLSAEQRNLLTTADGASRTLLKLVDDMLDIAKIDAGDLLIESQPLRLEDIVAGAFESVRALPCTPGVELVCDWGDASLLGARGQLLGDAGRLQQILVNLLANAIATTSKGQVLLRLAARPGDAQGRVPLALTVQDSGKGMTTAQLETLFRPLAAAGAAPQETGAARLGGAGLGLLLTRRLVALMAGALDVQSQPGRGTSIEVTLSLALDPQGRPALPPPAQRLLVASSRVDGRDATLALLRHLGCGAGLGASPDGAATLEALAQARAAGQPFDWLLMDWGLPAPGPNGADLIALVRRDHPSVRIAVLSPGGTDDEPTQARAFGARGVLPQPVLAADLRRLLSEPASDRASPLDSHSLTGLRVLLVEDHPINQEVALRLLGSRGAQVEVAANGQEGLARLRAAGPSAFDVVLMDLEMPVLDGLGATRQLRSLAGFEHLPVLAMTAHALAEERAACLAAGMQGHIAKPLDVGRLVTELQRYRPRPAPVPPRPVLDLERGLRQFDGQAALYRRTLQGFADQYREGVTRWGDWAAAGAWTDLRRAAHTLQGLAATLGAQPLHQLALSLERSAASADSAAVQPNLDRVQAGLALVLGEIDAALSQPADAPPPRETGPGPLGELRDLLAQSDSRALDWWQAHGAYSGLPPDVHRRLDGALSQLDFDAAAQALAEVAKDTT